MNSRSQSKIRSTNKANVLAEQRYFKNKNLLKEGPEEIQKCFEEAELDISDFSYCVSSGTMGPDPDECIKQIKEKVTDTEKLTNLITCLSTKIDFKDIINTGIQTGIDILGKLPNMGDILGGQK